MSLIKYMVSRYSDRPVPVEYARETTSYYIKANGRREAKTSQYYRYFDTEAEAQQFIAERQQAEKDAKRLKQIEKAAPDLLEALELVVTAVYNPTAEVPPESLLAIARAAIAKATGGDL